MADRYWVGGTGNWSSTTKWSLTSGGASGASVPTASDDVIFDANSGLTGATATVDTARTCNNLTITPSATIGVQQIAITVSLTVNGTFSMSGTAGNRRTWIRCTTYGLQQNFIVNAVSNLADLDFRDIIVTGTAAPISGTRIGDLRGNTGITFNTPKTVYWNLAGAQNWSANGWATTSTGTPSTNNFPLAQDTATFTNAGSVTGTITMDTAIPYTGTVDMSGRTSAMTLAVGAYSIYGNWANGSGTTLSGTNGLTFSGRNIQTITSAGKPFSNNEINVDTYGGTVELVDALNIVAQQLRVTNGTFDTKGYNVNAVSLLSNNSNVRTINLGASTVTLDGNSGPALVLTNSTNLTFNAGTSQINFPTSVAVTLNCGNVSFYNVSLTATTAVIYTITSANTFNNLTITAPASAGVMQVTFDSNPTINGTLTCAGASAVRRIFLQSSSTSVQRNFTVGTLVATDCDFRDIQILGTAAGSSPTRAGNCGGNAGITFPAAKTVYWNLAGAQNWSATGWSSSSGGSPDINQFPLAQDTAVFNEAGSVTGTITMNQAWNIGTVNMSGRTSAMAINFSVGISIYGSWTNGSGLTFSGTGALTFRGRGTHTITSAGKAFTANINIDVISGTVQLADALSVGTRSFSLVSGTFDAVNYNVTAGLFSSANSIVRTLNMGSGTWTIAGTGVVWNIATSTNLTLNRSTSTIVLSNTSATARTFNGGGQTYYNLTIGGTTGTSTLTLTGSNTFNTLSSTKTVAHTLLFASSTTNTFTTFNINGTAGNVVTIGSSSTANHTLAKAGGGTVTANYLSISRSTATPTLTWAALNSTDGGNNSGWYFGAFPAVGNSNYFLLF